MRCFFCVQINVCLNTATPRMRRMLNMLDYEALSERRRRQLFPMKPTMKQLCIHKHTPEMCILRCASTSTPPRCASCGVHPQAHPRDVHLAVRIHKHTPEMGILWSVSTSTPRDLHLAVCIHKHTPEMCVWCILMCILWFASTICKCMCEPFSRIRF